MNRFNRRKPTTVRDFVRQANRGQRRKITLRDFVRSMLRSEPGLKRPRVVCSRCNLREETGPCPGCQKYFCADCCEPHFAEDGPEYCLGLRIIPASNTDCQLV